MCNTASKASSATPKGRGAKMGDFITPNDTTPKLDRKLIEKANAAGTVVDYGDATQREYNNNISQIKAFELTNEEKTSAINELHSLTTKQLEAESKSLSPYSMGVGPARFNPAKMAKDADSAVNARARVTQFMADLKTKSDRNKAEKETRARITAFENANKSGSLSVKIGGKEYFRTTKKSTTWREGNLKDYKAQQKFTKSQKNLPFTQKRAWSQLSDAEKRKYY